MYFVVLLIVFSALEFSYSHLCIEEPRQRLEVTGTDDYYLDCYDYNGPCGNKFYTASPFYTTIKSGSNFTLKLYTPVIHSTPGYKGYFQVNLKPANSDKFVQLKKVSDDNSKYHDVQVNFPNVEGLYTLQVIHYSYNYVAFYSCSDIVFVKEDNISGNGSSASVNTNNTSNLFGYKGTGSRNLAASWTHQSPLSPPGARQTERQENNIKNQMAIQNFKKLSS